MRYLNPLLIVNRYQRLALLSCCVISLSVLSVKIDAVDDRSENEPFDICIAQVDAKKSKRKRRKKRYDRRQREAKKLIDAGHPTVELNLKTSPRVRASVYHGKELLGTAPLHLTWPKDTGALDLKLKAKGYLTVNTRLYTYRDDRVTVKMFKVDEAHKLFGYKKKVKSPKLEGEGSGE